MIRVIPVFKQIEQKMETKKDKKEKRKEEKRKHLYITCLHICPVHMFLLLLH